MGVSLGRRPRFNWSIAECDCCGAAPTACAHVELATLQLGRAGAGSWVNVCAACLTFALFALLQGGRVE